MFIINNLSVIRDILWIIFTLIATIIAILTYRKAKSTVFQPLRTEVIKRQTELLVEILDYLADDGIHFDFKLDYMGIIACNSYLLLKHYGFILANDSVGDSVNKNLAGMLILKESGVLKSISLPKIFDENKEKNSDTDIGEEDLKLAKQGIVDLEMLHLTRKYSDCISKLNYFIKNPFTPNSIQTVLKELVQNIMFNLTHPMKDELVKFVIELCKRKGATKENPIVIEYNAIYNEFQRKSRDNTPLIEEIRDITRKYLMIDIKWK